MTLRERLDALAAQTRGQLSSEWLAVIDRTTEDLKRMRLAERILKVGDSAPAFALPNARGQIVRSGELLRKGHLLVSFYRGGW